MQCHLCVCSNGGGPEGGPPCGELLRPPEGEEEPEWGRGSRGPERGAGWTVLEGGTVWSVNKYP